MRILSARHFLWWVSHPSEWPEAVRRMVAGRRGRSWCRQHAVGGSEALEALGFPGKVERVRDRHPEELRAAALRQERCPHRMGGSSNLDLVFTLCECLGAKRVVETGVAYGWSSLAILLSLQRRTDALLWSVDRPYPFLGDEAADCVGIVVPDHLRRRWFLYRVPDRQGLPRALAEAGIVDFCHYDSDKSASGKAWAFPLIWERLAPGGVVMCDDVDDDLTFRDFAASLGSAPVVVADRGKYQGLLRKPVDGDGPPSTR